MDYHLRAGSFFEMIGRHAPTTRKQLSFIEAAGIDRADELTFICFNPDNALFYGIQSGLQIPPNFVSTMIRAIPPDKIRSKKINVVLSGEEYFGQTTPIEEELKALSLELGFELRVVVPERLILNGIKERLQTVAQEKLLNEPINIVLAGEGKAEVDQLMLNRFYQALLSIRIDGRKTNVSLISHDRVGDQTPEIKEKREILIKKLLQRSDLNICYGDTDIGTSTVAELLIRVLNAERKQTLALAEMIASSSDFERANIPYLLVYKLVLDELTKKN